MGDYEKLEIEKTKSLKGARAVSLSLNNKSCIIDPVDRQPERVSSRERLLNRRKLNELRSRYFEF